LNTGAGDTEDPEGGLSRAWQIALFRSGSVSQKFAPIAAKSGCVVSIIRRLRMDPEVPSCARGERARIAGIRNAHHRNPNCRPSRWWSFLSHSTTMQGSRGSWSLLQAVSGRKKGHHDSRPKSSNYNTRRSRQGLSAPDASTVCPLRRFPETATPRKKMKMVNETKKDPGVTTPSA